MSYVKLAIRVRPTTEGSVNSNQHQLSPVSGVTVESETNVCIRNPKIQGFGAGDSRNKLRKFHADFCFDSTSHGSATQEKVYETLAPEILKSLDTGRSVCVVAYGQSGTGKTHTMMGSSDDPGIIPRLCRDLCKSCNQVVVSYLEIYNERVHDLLGLEVGESQTDEPSLRVYGNSGNKLRIREHPNSGPYVQNLRHITVSGEESLLSLVRRGTSRRRTAATAGHHYSSRSHALLELRTEKGSLYLADLAGSEKANSEAGFIGRLKEGANINKSLVALSNVINALASRGWRSRYIPYRDSILTWLLKDSFSGGGSTFIIATISPDVSNYGPTVSTLRWASRARKLPPPKLGFNSSTIRVAALLRALSKHHIHYIPETGTIKCDPKYWLYIWKENIESQTETLFSECLQPDMDKPEANERRGSLESIASKKLNFLRNKNIDRILGPILNRTSSDHDISKLKPHKDKRPFSRSHEILPVAPKTKHDDAKKMKESNNSLTNSSLKSEPNRKTSIKYDLDKRAAIVASVTDRLYNKVKKKKEAAASRMNSDLSINSAKNKIVEFGQRIRSKRRVSTSTQTIFPIVRVKDQCIDVQTDLDTFYIKRAGQCVMCQNVGTETNITTARCKEAASGRGNGSIHVSNSSTSTETPPLVLIKSLGIMTENSSKKDTSTQTQIKPPPRRRKIGQTQTTAATINIKIAGSNDSCTMSEDSIENYNDDVDSDNEPFFLAKTEPLEPNCVIMPRWDLPVDDVTSDSDDFVALPRRVATDNSIYLKRDFKDLILGTDKNTYPFNIAISPQEEKVDRKVKFVDDETVPLVKMLTIGTQTDRVKFLESAIGNKTLTESTFPKDSDSNFTFDPVEHNLKPSFFVTDKRKDVSARKSNVMLKPINEDKHRNATYDNYDIKKFAETCYHHTTETRISPKLITSDKQHNQVRPVHLSIVKEEPYAGSSSELDFSDDFQRKKKFFENYISENCQCYSQDFHNNDDDFCAMGKHLMNSCDRMENSIHRHRKFLKDRQNSYLFLKGSQSRQLNSEPSPSEYLQRLVEIRRQVVESERQFQNVHF